MPIGSVPSTSNRGISRNYDDESSYKHSDVLLNKFGDTINEIVDIEAVKKEMEQI